MKILRTLGMSLVAFSLLAGGFIVYTKVSQAAEITPSYRYEIANQSQSPVLSPAQPGILMITLKNTGTAPWPTHQLYMGSIYFDGTPDRPSQFATTAWIDQNRIMLYNSLPQDSINPGDTVTFYIPIQAPTRNAIYQENFNLHAGLLTVMGDPIRWQIQVGNELSYQSAAGKQIKIWRAEQRIWAIENDVVVMDIPISSGRAGYTTPKGNYTIFNHKETAYSAPYQLWMDYWMALKNSYGEVTGYGLHRLPYWKVSQGNRVEGEVKNGRLYTNGKLYEDYEHLGKPMSHGCVRLGIETSRILYYWAPNGTPVVIA
ncbi:MAG: L,D-transpeptidase family protein [Patescibacteria group bacterium]